MSLTEALHKCNTGKHDLIEIYRAGGWDDEEVVRWCRVCGSIVVDMETDNRLRKSGGVLKMMSPQITKNKQIYFSSHDG